MKTWARLVTEHYRRTWKGAVREHRWGTGPVHQLPPEFCVLEFGPTASRRAWTYATCCMSQPEDPWPLETFLLALTRARDELVELLTMMAHFHRTGEALGLGHTVNFGRPWLLGSRCDHGLFSLPYLDGPSIESIRGEDGEDVGVCAWLIPITQAEREFKRLLGIDALEQRFEATSFNYMDPHRPSLVELPLSIFDRVQALAPGTEIPKPEAKSPFTIKGMGKRRGELALVYRIPAHKGGKPHEKGIARSELEAAFEQLQVTGQLTREWFNESLSACAKEGGCNFTTIGGLLELLGEASYDHRGVYRRTRVAMRSHHLE